MSSAPALTLPPLFQTKPVFDDTQSLEDDIVEDQTRHARASLASRSKAKLRAAVHKLSQKGIVLRPDVLHRLGLASMDPSAAGGPAGGAGAGTGGGGGGGGGSAASSSLHDAPLDDAAYANKEASLWDDLLGRGQSSDDGPWFETDLTSTKDAEIERLTRLVCRLALRSIGHTKGVHVASLTSASQAQEWAKSGAVTERHARRRLQLLEHKRQEVANVSEEERFAQHFFWRPQGK